MNNLLAGGMEGAKGFMFFICNMELTTEGQGLVNNSSFKGYMKISPNSKFMGL